MYSHFLPAFLALCLLPLCLSQDAAPTSDVATKCPCFCFNMGPFFRRVNRAEKACAALPADLASVCAVDRTCVRDGRRGASCCNIDPVEMEPASPTPKATTVPDGESQCPCKCRARGKGRKRGVAECREIKAFCRIQRCGVMGKGKTPRWSCCDK